MATAHLSRPQAAAYPCGQRQVAVILAVPSIQPPLLLGSQQQRPQLRRERLDFERLLHEWRPWT
jgi:hypothetical protein